MMNNFISTKLASSKVNDERLSRQYLIQPIELLTLPNDLNGTHHWNFVKYDLNAHLIANDLNSIIKWLEEYENQYTVQKSCRSAIEKLLLWCLVERGHALSDLSVEEIEQFINFLTDVRPFAVWVSEANNRRNSSKWRPFRKQKLNTTSISMILIHIKLYFQFVIENGRIDLLPLDHEFKRWTTSSRSPFNYANRLSTPPKILIRQWVLLRQHMPNASSASIMQLKMIVVLEMLYFAGLTLCHIRKLLWSDLQPIYENGILVTWKIPVEERFGGYVYSIATLTSSLSQLKNMQHDSMQVSKCSPAIIPIIGRSINLFYIEMNEVRKRSLNKAKILELDDDSNILSKLNVSQIRGGAMFIAQLLNVSHRLVDIYGEMLLNKFPLMKMYLDEGTFSDIKKTILTIKHISDWFANQNDLENQFLSNCKEVLLRKIEDEFASINFK